MTIKKKKTTFKKPKKQYIKKHRFYLSFFYPRLDKWLKRMSLCGFHIVHCGLFTFWFEVGVSLQKEYFTFSEVLNEGKYSILLRHPCFQEKYGVTKNKSTINANRSKAYQIVEIDLEKINVESDVGYKELVRDRNVICRQYGLRNICLLLFVGLLLGVLSFLGYINLI